MINVGEILDDRCVLLDISEKRKKHVVAALVNAVANAGFIENPSQVVRDVLERESKASTGIGRGVAIPHLLADGINTTVMAFARSRVGVPFDAIDGRPVRLFFLILGPQGFPGRHLQLLSRLSRLLHHEECLAGLLDAQSAGEVRSILSVEEAE